MANTVPASTGVADQAYIDELKGACPEAILVWDRDKDSKPTEQVAIGDGCDYDDCMEFIQHRLEVLGSLDKLADEWETDPAEFLRYMIQDEDDDNLEADVMETYSGVEVEDL